MWRRASSCYKATSQNKIHGHRLSWLSLYIDLPTFKKFKKQSKFPSQSWMLKSFGGRDQNCLHSMLAPFDMTEPNLITLQSSSINNLPRLTFLKLNCSCHGSFSIKREDIRSPPCTVLIEFKMRTNDCSSASSTNRCFCNLKHNDLAFLQDYLFNTFHVRSSDDSWLHARMIKSAPQFKAKVFVLQLVWCSSSQRTSRNSTRDDIGHHLDFIAKNALTSIHVTCSVCSETTSSLHYNLF